MSKIEKRCLIHYFTIVDLRSNAEWYQNGLHALIKGRSFNIISAMDIAMFK